VGDIVGAMLFDRRGAVFLCALLASAVLLLAGCGGKSSTAGSAATGTSASATSNDTSTAASGASSSSGTAASAFIAQADTICGKANVLLARSSRAKGRTTAELAAAVVANETIERKAAAELAGLMPPTTLAPAWKRLLNDRRALADELGNLAAAVKRESQEALVTLGKSKKKLHTDLRQVAGKAGFKDCAKIG
jgi:hypothetical protein